MIVTIQVLGTGCRRCGHLATNAQQAVNQFDDVFADRLEQVMRRFEELTGRGYHAFDCHGHPEADRVIVLMGSGAECRSGAGAGRDVRGRVVAAGSLFGRRSVIAR